MKAVWVQPHRRQIPGGFPVVVMGHWRMTREKLSETPPIEETRPIPTIWERLLEDEPE